MKRLLKIIGWSLLTIIVLLLLAVTAVLWYLTPEKLTPIVEREVTARIDGRLEVSRIELTFWSTFPRFELDVDSLLIISNRLNSVDSIDKSVIPANADSLFSVDKLHGAINVAALARQQIELSDLLIVHPRANIVVAPGGTANYDIFNSTEEPDDTTSTPLPDITVNSFQLIDAGPITYRSIPDSLYMSVNISGTSLTEVTPHAYNISITGDAMSPLLDDYNLTPLTVGIDGRIDWSPARPAAVQLSDIDLNINEINSLISANVDATDHIIIRQLDIELKSLNVNDVIAHLPQPVSQQLANIDTDMTVDATFSLTSPYTLLDSLTIPSVTATLNIPDCHFYWNDLHLNKATLAATVTVDGDNPDNSQLEIGHLVLDGRAMEVNARGTVTGPLDNPAIDTRLAMALKLGRLPRKLRDKLPVTIAGRLSADTDLRMHLKDMTAKGFHKIHMDGEVRLTDFDIMSRDSLLVGHTELAVLKFGTDRTLHGPDRRIDSLLTASVSIDTLSLEVPGLIVRGSALSAALGTLNRSTSSDTSAINPFGGMVRFSSLILDQPADSMTLRLRDMQSHVALTRYEGARRAPKLHFDLNARRIGTRMPDMAIAISQPNILLDAHLITTDNTVRRDSTSTRRRRQRTHNGDSISRQSEVIDWNISNDLKTLIKRWEINGRLTSNRAFIFTRAFPLRQRAADIDLYFNTDTVRLNNLKYNIGNTRLDIKGEITNIERALTGRSNRSKLKIRCDVEAPFIDITELATTTFYESSGYAGPDPDYDEDTYYTNNNVASDSTTPRPVLIPRNIDANLSVMADSIKYSDLIMEKFSGSVLINNCAVNLHDLHASTEIGSASLSALYWAPDTTRMQFGMGAKLNGFHIDRVLSMIPAVDSLLPALQGFSGIINADLAASTSITPAMNIDMPTFKGALKLDGDSLVLLDADTFKMLAKWLVFKNKKRNMIDHMEVEIAVDDNTVQIYPFIFDIDRYKLGVMGRNDLDMNLDYHVSVLKSPLPFKFGINIKGTLDNPKIKLGGAKIKPGQATTYAIADSTRINLLNQIEDVFRRGAMTERNMEIKTRRAVAVDTIAGDNLSANDSIMMQKEGFLPPDTVEIKAEEPKTKRRFPWKK
ncbi:MAG: hypothetical protein K2N28_04765 [Muribaculaceae bacterium]|nr:hypothetical protein [Muribaculaceae bacterium]